MKSKSNLNWTVLIKETTCVIEDGKMWNYTKEKIAALFGGRWFTGVCFRCVKIHCAYRKTDINTSYRNLSVEHKQNESCGIHTLGPTISVRVKVQAHFMVAARTECPLCVFTVTMIIRSRTKHACLLQAARNAFLDSTLSSRHPRELRVILLFEQEIVWDVTRRCKWLAVWSRGSGAAALPVRDEQCGTHRAQFVLPMLIVPVPVDSIVLMAVALVVEVPAAAENSNNVTDNW